MCVARWLAAALEHTIAARSLNKNPDMACKMSSNWLDKLMLSSDTCSLS